MAEAAEAEVEAASIESVHEGDSATSTTPVGIEMGQNEAAEKVVVGGTTSKTEKFVMHEESSLNILSVHGAAAGHSEGHRLAGDTERVRRSNFEHFSRTDAEHESHSEHVRIPKGSRLCRCGKEVAEEEQKYWCGPKDGLIRSRVYHFLEQHWLQSILVILLLLDVLITMGELLAGWKVIPVDSAHGWQYLENNGMPREYLCAVGSDNMESCCRETLSLYNTKRSQPPFENVAECLLLTKNISAGHNTHGLHGSSPSTASHVSGGHSDHGGGHGRMLSASEHGDEPFSFQESTCYAPSHNFVRHHDHGTLETILHWIGVSIIVVFLTELTLLIYVFGPTQFFCSFYPVFREGDLVRIVRHGNTTKRFVVAELAKISHVNPATGQCDVVVLKKSKTGRLKMIGALYDQAVHHVEMLEMSTSSGPRRFWQGWYHKGYVLDFVVVLVSFITEIGVDGSAVTLFIILRLWRIIRVFHGLYEGKHKLGREMHEMQEEFSDVKLNHQILLTDIFRYDNGQKSAEEVVEKVKEVFQALHSDIIHDLELAGDWPPEIGDATPKLEGASSEGGGGGGGGKEEEVPNMNLENK